MVSAASLFCRCPRDPTAGAIHKVSSVTSYMISRAPAIFLRSYKISIADKVSGVALPGCNNLGTSHGTQICPVSRYLATSPHSPLAGRPRHHCQFRDLGERMLQPRQLVNVTSTQLKAASISKLLNSPGFRCVKWSTGPSLLMSHAAEEWKFTAFSHCRTYYEQHGDQMSSSLHPRGPNSRYLVLCI